MFSYGKSTGSVWGGVTHFPLRLQLNNFQVLSTDYENYAIVYECMEKSVLYNRDIIFILLRDPELDKLQSGTLDHILDEFKRFFSGPQEEQPVKKVDVEPVPVAEKPEEPKTLDEKAEIGEKEEPVG